MNGTLVIDNNQSVLRHVHCLLAVTNLQHGTILVIGNVESTRWHAASHTASEASTHKGEVRRTNSFLDALSQLTRSMRRVQTAVLGQARWLWFMLRFMQRFMLREMTRC